MTISKKIGERGKGKVRKMIKRVGNDKRKQKMRRQKRKMTRK